MVDVVGESQKIAGIIFDAKLSHKEFNKRALLDALAEAYRSGFYEAKLHASD